MIANYHTHTVLCSHAEGTMREYIDAARVIGIKTLGFSDHAPYPFPDGYTSSIRIPMNMREAYVSKLLELKEEFKGEVEILIGYEAEYYPLLFEKALENLKKSYFDYLILGQHFVKNEFDCVKRPSLPDDSVERLYDYVNQVAAGIKTGYFSYVAHPDLINFTGDPEIYREAMTRLCVAAKECDVPLELNLLGLKKNRSYPNREFWSIVKEIGNSVILGIDAHAPTHFSLEAIKNGERYLEEFGIKPIEKLTLKSPI